MSGESVQLGVWLFYLLAGLTVGCGAGVAFSRSIIYSALFLLGTLLGVGSLYAYLHADYVAVAQLLVYVGGVLVLILFSVMMTSRIGDASQTNPSRGVVSAAALALGLAGVLGFLAVKAPWKVAVTPLAPEPTAERLGDLFLGRYLLPFEVLSLLLLAVLVGAVVVARKEIKE